jgi:sarcosine oxidase subunit beta
MPGSKADVVVIGGGISGLSTAYHLAKAGKDVAVIEKSVVGAEASGRNGGMISERTDEPDLVPLAVESVRLWPTLDDELGYPTEFVQKGRLQVAVSEAEMDRYLTEREVGERFGVHVDVLDPHEIQDMAPIVTDRSLGGIFFPKGAHANPQRSVQAFAWAFQDRGGRLYQHTTVTGFKLAGERVAAVETTGGDIEADTVVCAAGPQTALFLDMVGVRVPLATARAEIIATAPLEPLFQMALVGNGLYGRQAKNGNLLYGGGPHEWIDVELTANPSKPNTPLIRNIARRLADLFPGVADVPVIRSWAGVIEQAPDSLPIIDVLDRPSNFVFVSASAHGFAIAAATGKVMSELVLHGKSSVDISGLRMDRFGDVAPKWREELGWMPVPN